MIQRSWSNSSNAEFVQLIKERGSCPALAGDRARCKFPYHVIDLTSSTQPPISREFLTDSRIKAGETNLGLDGKMSFTERQHVDATNTANRSHRHFAQCERVT